MKKLLNWGAVGLLSSAILDPLICVSMGRPVAWITDFVMVTGGALCFYLLVRFREWI